MKNLLNFFKKKTETKYKEICGVKFKFKKNPLSKNIRISPKNPDFVLVTLPKSCPYKQAENFAKANIDEIKKIRKNIKATDAAYIEKLRKEAKEYLPKRLLELAEKYGYSYKKVTIKRLKSRWGSCSWKNNINLNLSLMTLEDDLIDYVLLHELCHTVEKNHSGAFWSRLQGHMQDAKIRQARLKSKNVI